MPASLACARPGSRSGITGPTPTDPRFANYEEIQRHLSRRQAAYHSQRREHPARSERPVSNFYEYESVQSNISHGRQLSQGSSGSGSQMHHQSGLPHYRTVSPPRQEMGGSGMGPTRRPDPPPPHYRMDPPPYVRQPPGALSVAPLHSSHYPSQLQGRGDYEDCGRGAGGQLHQGREGRPLPPPEHEDPYGRVMFRPGHHPQHPQGQSQVMPGPGQPHAGPAPNTQRRASQSHLLQGRSQSHSQVPNNVFMPPMTLPPGSKV